jgi:hypothetical protein
MPVVLSEETGAVKRTTTLLANHGSPWNDERAEVLAITRGACLSPLLP